MTVKNDAMKDSVTKTNNVFRIETILIVQLITIKIFIVKMIKQIIGMYMVTRV